MHRCILVKFIAATRHQDHVTLMTFSSVCHGFKGQKVRQWWA